ncbi:MAG TPA: dynamin family protein [Cyanobacteria bacterium UBA11369]|nr:dynamin family protein [Cyanobacteria bacterium UBA11371]HBE31351.1 dynamin family protein [Cyanobacteria bacterium UBA11368]HBE53996.1 dynamin family protein [Cyanobacteria bacterium UBA11369]
MNTALVGSEAVDLLSRITGGKVSQRHLSPRVIFLVALVTVLLGVMFADGTVSDEEKQRWQKTINQFIPPEGNVRQLTQLISKGVRQNQIYKKTKDLLTLTAPLSDAERLLLIAFGYEMAAADGEIATLEKKYLEAVAKLLGINHQYLAVLEAGFTHQGTVDPAVLDEMQSLLAPARFHELDTIFVKAASDIIALLPAKPKHQKTQKHRDSYYHKLQEFQKYRQLLNNLCNQLNQVIQDCSNHDLLPHKLTEDIVTVSHKIQSQRFRLAVVGEFSQGKSTLLNALLGEEIQPVRAIPCSGTVTVLKYGAQKRVVCRYKDREEEIPPDQYQEKAAISEDAALGNLIDELAQSDIEEIILEHPDLDLCQNGVEIVDSPGLNENPKRTDITKKLLKDTDAAIFLANASRPLTQGERDLIQDLKIKLNGGNKNEPADNLFVVVNFMDLLRREKDIQQVKQMFKNFTQGINPIITGENRIHFISAQAALDAILEGTEDEYFKAFYSFTHSLERFLTTERGLIQLKQYSGRLQQLIQSGLDGLHQAEDVLDGKLKISQEHKQNILEKIGEASGRDVKIRCLADKLVQQAIEQAEQCWDEWAEGLQYRIEKKSQNWSSDQNEREKLFQDYANQLIKDLSADFDDWFEKKIKGSIIQPRIKVLDREIHQEIEAIQSSIQSLDLKTGSNLSGQLDLSISGAELNMNLASSMGADSSDEGGAGWFAGLGGGGLVTGALLAFTGLGLIPVALIGGAAALGLGWLFGEDEDEVRAEVKQSVCEQCFKKLSELEGEIFENVCENIASVLYSRVDAASKVIEQAISLAENLLEQQEKAHEETLEQQEADKAFIAQKRQELEQVQKNLEAILHQVAV